MARIKIPFLGVSTHSNHKDGECRSVVNMRPENGVWQPVAPRKVVQSFSDTYDIVFVHRGNGYENWIGIKNSETYSIIYKDIEDTPTTVSNPLSGIINSVEQIGNTLSFTTDTTIYYALYKNGNYVFLGEMPDLPNMFIGAYNETSISRTYAQEYGTSVDWNDSLNLTKGLSYKITDILINGGMVNDQPFEGKGIMLFDAHLLRYAFRLYDGTLIKHSSPLLIMPATDIRNLKKIKFELDSAFAPAESVSYVKVTAYNIGISIDLSPLAPWKDIIVSIDLFLSPPVGLMNIENLTKDRMREELLTAINSPGGVGPESQLFKTLNKDALKSLSTESKFYFIKSLKVDEWSYIDPLNPYIFPTSQPDLTKLENLSFQELMSNDQFSHHKYGAKKTLVYNNRLRLKETTTTFFKGFNSDHFDWGTNYNGISMPSNPINMPIVIETELFIDNKTEKVYSFYQNYFGDAGYAFFQAYLSYPDQRAKKMKIYAVNGTTWEHIFTADLEPHDGLNIAYFINRNLEPIYKVAGTDKPAVTNIQPVVLTEQSKLKISEINNPFLFPTLNTYQIGIGRIMNESSIIMNVTDRNYGMYPVFVFSEDGVFTMAGQTSEEVHKSVQAPTYMEPPVSDVICATPYGVAFITKRGLMLINQYKTEFISPQLREKDEVIEINTTGINHPSIAYPGEPFETYLSGVDMMLYNPYRDELIIIDKDKPYNYVYDFASKVYWLSTEAIDNIVQNVYPEVFAIGNNELKDFKDMQGKATQIALVTRPVTFGTTDLKKFERVFLRSVMRNVNNQSATDKMIVAVFHSLDGVHLEPTRGIKLTTNGNYKDVDLGLMSRVKFRQYIFMLAGTIDEDSEIQYVEFETDKEYGNEKMR